MMLIHEQTQQTYNTGSRFPFQGQLLLVQNGMETTVTHVLVHDPQVLGGGVKTRPHELDQVRAM